MDINMIFFEKHGVDEKDFFRSMELKNFNFPLHFHRAYELIYIKEGYLQVSVDKRMYRINKGELLFLFPNQIHDFQTLDYSEITIILFSPELIGHFYVNYKGVIPEDNRLYIEELDTKRLETFYGRKSFIYLLCDMLIHKTKFMPIKQTPQMTILYKVLLYVEQTYSTQCTLKSASKYLKYDYHYLSKLFANLMNMTFTEYLNYYRISQASYLLKNTSMPIGEIAVNCGYQNLRTFHRNFQRINGSTPYQYRSE